MKIKLLSCLLLCMLVLALPLSAAPPKGQAGANNALQIDNTQIIDANRIMMFVTNHGNFGRDLGGYFGYDYGTWFPFSDTASIRTNQNEAAVHSPLYAAGLWIGAVDSATGETRIAIAEYSDEYVPGPMADSTFQTDRPAFKVYKLYADSFSANPNADYLNWPVDQGAPVVHDSLGNVVTDAGGYPVPEMFGDQMCWAVFNDADPAQHSNASGETLPLGLEVRQSTFAFNREGSLGNIIILRMRVYNRGANTLTNTYFSIWSDPDLGGAGDDLVGCDTTLGIGYIYNATNSDQNYGAMPPCLAFDFFQGPLINTGDPADTGLMWGDTFPGYRNMNMTSFNKYINGTDPDNFGETYNYMRGLNRDGTPYVYNGDTLLFQVSGDPVTDVGDLDIAQADRRFMMSTGPITFRPGDSLEILAALIVGQGSDRLSSITVMKDLDNFAQKLYENGFNPPKPPAKPVVTVARTAKEITLQWTDTSEVDPGDFSFEGYSVWQGPSASGPWTLLNTYDLVNDRTDALIDTVALPGTSILLPVVRRLITNTGLKYSYSITKDQLTGEDLFPVQTYYFRVTAFSFDYITPAGDVVPNGDRFLESQTTVSATPQAPLAGIHPQVSSSDTLAVTHTGPSDGAVYPIVLDPLAVTGDTYRVIFYQDPSLGIVWHLIDVTTGDTLLLNQVNQAGDDAYISVDGIMVKVQGPPLAGKAYTYTAATPPNISAVVQVEDPTYVGNTRWFSGDPANGGELLFGAIFMEPNFWGETSLNPGENPPVEVRWRPMQSYTDLNSNGVYDIGEPYVVDDPGLTQGAFMYTGFAGGTYEGFYSVPFTAWDVTDPGNPRQVNVVMRDRDGNHQWDLHHLTTPADPLLPNNGDQQFNYTWVTTSDYDASGTHYGDGNGGTVDFWSYDDSTGIWDAAWMMWLYPRGAYKQLAEECILGLIPPALNLQADTFTFVAGPVPTETHTQSDLDAITAVPNPFYLAGPYDPAPGSYQLKWHHLPEKCTITVYNLAGELVRTIHKDDASTAIASWDLLTERGLPVASGIYIYVVDAPGFGQKIGKVAVFVESEVLKIY